MTRIFFAAALLVLPFCNIRAADFATEIMEATYKLGENGSYATCFLVRPEAPDTALYLVTAAHALDDNTAESILLALRKPTADGGYERVNHKLPLRRDGKPVWVRHPDHDVAVIRIADSLPIAASAVPLSVLADEARLKSSGSHLCSTLFVLGYPEGLEGDASGLAVARLGIFASPPSLPMASHPTFLADYTASGGDSGGPVFRADAEGHLLLLGLVTEQHYYADEMQGINQKHTIRTPLGAVKILHAKYVRDTIEKAARAGQ